MIEDLATVSLRICHEGKRFANALALNKDCTQVAVAGRSVLKVFSIGTDGFDEVCNMSSGKNQNLSYSSNDVAWSTLDSNILATAATNGVVSLWDLSKFGRQKQQVVYYEHERTAHTVTFHSSEPNILISGSQDGTIKCFDIRCEKSIYTYFSNSESVRDVKFNPHTINVFSAVSENGTVQLWDMRKSEKCFLQFTAHSGPIYTCDWHPTRNWLATGSRDKQIKVWNMDGKASLEHTIHTIAVVGRVKWRPECTYHIASCALVVDYSIHVWDIRRPYIPFASFNDHTNVTTGIAWKGDDSHCLLSTSKDSTIYKHAFKDATRPADRANGQGASLGRRGDISFANKIKVQASTNTAQVIKSSSFLSRHNAVIGVEQFHVAQSELCKFLLKSTHTGYSEPDLAIPLKEHESFIGCAKEIILIGPKLVELCDRNAQVCKKFGKHSATTLWNLIKVLYGNNDFNQADHEHRNSQSGPKAQLLPARRPTQVHPPSTLTTETMQWEQTKNDKVENDDDRNCIETPDENIINNTNASTKQHSPPYSSVIVSDTQVLNEINFENFDLLRNGFIYVGPPDIPKASTFTTNALHCNVQEARPQQDLKLKEKEKLVVTSDTLKVAGMTHVPMWRPHKFMSDALVLQSDIGDVQTALTILICMGEARKLLPIEDSLVEHWFHAYIDQLHRYQLWNEACTVINMSWMRSIRSLNQKSTTVHTNCGDCGRPLGGSSGWFCQKCKSMQSSKCCVCGLIVRGLYAWCQGCSHGGHLDHLMEYFANRSKCPKCGHLCEYN